MREALTGADDMGRQTLRRLSPFTLVGVAAQGGVRIRSVPAEFWSSDTEEDGTEIGLVSCPCGAIPRLELLAIVDCECQRTYFHGVKEIWSLNVPSGRESGESE